MAWQDSKSRSWHTVAVLSRVDKEYELSFTKGAKRLQPVLKNLFGLDPEFRYRFSALIPAFKNKIPPRSRSDYSTLSRWLGVTEHDDEMAVLAKFGQLQSNEPIILYPEPVTENGLYEFEFFVHSLRYMHPDALDWCRAAKAGAKLNPMLDVKNEVDPFAVAVRSTPGCILLGYVPTFFARDASLLLRRPEVADKAEIHVLEANPEAPAQMMLRCKFSSICPNDFVPLDSENFQLMRA
ncbi:hypothetical protein [Methylobacterium oryzae]|uniref:hypothetical protein n=1 Tax=Methylobacterium oryzae TaxID=334852 RepID=UPI0011DCCCED|nr:hypothetical protein [Methylobacterium oryzae]